jgi:hypothetical protein
VRPVHTSVFPPTRRAVLANTAANQRLDVKSAAVLTEVAIDVSQFLHSATRASWPLQATKYDKTRCRWKIE